MCCPFTYIYPYILFRMGTDLVLFYISISCILPSMIEIIYVLAMDILLNHISIFLNS